MFYSNDYAVNQSQSLLTKAVVIWLIFVVIRNIPSIITAIYLSAEAKRHNQKRLLWGLLGYAFPIITPIGFFIYIKYSEKRVNPALRKGISKKSTVSFFVSSVIIFISFILAVSASIMSIGSFVRAQVTGEHLVIYYDKMGNEYNELDITIDMYDRDGNKYVYTDKGLFKPVVYVDENGNEYDADKCFIDSDGWFFYDENDSLKIEEDYEWYICVRYEDADGNKYFQLDTASFAFDENGEIWAYLGKAREKLDFKN